MRLAWPALACLPLLTACVSIQVEPLTKEPLPAARASTSIEALDREPARPHVKLARITALTHDASEDTMRRRILSQGKKLGADAVIFGKADVISSMGAGPLYQSTASPAGTSNSYSGGYWNPFRMDAWTFIQSGSDQQQWTLYLSGVAIQYENAAETQAADASPR
jgi:hypothetical protein